MNLRHVPELTNERHSGVYVLGLEVDEHLPELAVGQLGRFDFREGYYVYVGSALQGLHGRLERHARRRGKNKHWHIDYLVDRVRVSWIFVWPTQRDLECRLSTSVKELSDSALRGFGCSDCQCDSHLYFFPSDPRSRLGELCLQLQDGGTVRPRRVQVEAGQ